VASTQHVLVIGETQSGKTFYANKLHQGFPRVSIFFNTNHVPGIWGEKADSPRELARVLTRSKKVNYLPPANVEEATTHLQSVVDFLFRHGKGAEGEVWAQLIVDEAQEFSRENSSNDPVRLVATRGLGAYGVRLVVITQYPVTLNTTTRTNCAYRVIFRPGIEGTRFLQSYGAYPSEEIEVWTRQKYHFVTYAPDRGWRKHTPVR